MVPVTARIILKAASLTAVDTFERHVQTRRSAPRIPARMERMDFMLLPLRARRTRMRRLRRASYAEHELGYYTNFANLLDLAAPRDSRGHRSMAFHSALH